jgi:sRNA-binding carbon storage regulator CsrA
MKSKIISDGVTISVEKANKSQVKLGIRAPESMAINREGKTQSCLQ